MKQILCFGDSNTWGLVPGKQDRYLWGIRWTSLLQEKLYDKDVRIIEEGLCGRTTIFEDNRNRVGRKAIDLLPVILESHSPLDFAVIMLGSNDCKSFVRASALEIGNGLSLCIDVLKTKIPAHRILVISPLVLGDDVWRPEKDPDFDIESIKVSRQLKEVFRAISDMQGTFFMAASDIAKASKVDDEHFDEIGHKKFAEAVYEKLLELKVVD